jgi:FG-GAP-like repeat
MPSPFGRIARFLSTRATCSRKHRNIASIRVAQAAASAVEILEDRLCLSVGVEATFLPAQIYQSSAATIISADLNGDGRPDLITNSPAGNVVRVALNAGDGTFPTVTDLNVTDPRSVAVADFNGDGIPDIAVTSPNDTSSRILIFYGLGNGAFGTPVRYPVNIPTVNLAVADLNGDGRPDLIFTSSQRISVMLNLGNETFARRVTYKAGPDDARMLIAGDFNNDGVPDVAVLRSSPHVDILLGQKDANGHPTGTLGPPVSFNAGPNPVDLATADFNHDGKPDLVIVNSGFRVTSMGVLLGNGDGTFAPRQSYFDGNFVDGVAVADFNGDGNADIATVSFTSGMRIYRGNGDGTFTPPTLYNGGNPGLSVTAADLNGDGRIDTAIASGFNFRTLLNSTGTTPPPAAPGTLDVTLGAGNPRSISYMDAAGTPATIRFAGPGSAIVHFTGDNLANAGSRIDGSNVMVASIAATGTTTSTTLTITPDNRNGIVTVGPILTDGSLGSLVGLRVNLNGNLTIAGTARSITLKDVSNGSISVGGPTAASNTLVVSVTNATNESLSSGTAIVNLSAGQWLSPAGGVEAITAPSIGTLNVAEEFSPDLIIGAGGIRAASVRAIVGGTWTVAGRVGAVKVGGNATFNLTAASIGSLAVGSVISNSVIRSAGDIGSLSALAMANSAAYAGVGTLPAGQRLPAMAADFTAAASIGSVSLSRKKGVIGFANSVIAASTIRQASLGNIDFANNGQPFGIAAHVLKEVDGADASTRRPFTLHNPTGTAALIALGFNPQDFVLLII